MKLHLSIVLYFISAFLLSAQYDVSGGIGSPLLDKDNSTSTEKIYILNTLNNATISYTTSQSIVKFYKYSQSALEKEPIPSSDISTTNSSNETTYTIKNIEDSKGYFAEADGSTTPAIWIIDYSKHVPQLNSLGFSDNEDKCEYLKILVNKSDDLYFYSMNGAKKRLIRKYDLEYTDQAWNEEENKFETITKQNEGLDIGTEYVIKTPLIDTQFKLSGDQFAKYFGINIEISSSLYTAIAVEGHIVSEQITENRDEKATELEAPVEFKFYGKGNTATTFYTWFIYKTTDLDNPIIRYTDQDINYTFRESGEYVVRLEVTDNSSQCIATDSVQIQTSSSLLNVPNFLVLDGEHKFRVTYKSLSTFKCSIFNRWGNKIYEFTDPNQGWDGKYKGKYVTPGVYFYVIRAKGADGIERNKAGDVNVLRSK